MSIYSLSRNAMYAMYMFISFRIIMYLQSVLNEWSIKEIEKNIYEVTIMLNNKIIKILVRVKKGPSKILQIINDDNEDVTNALQPYYNYKYINCTPDVYGYKSVEVLYVDGFENTIRGEETIN